MAEVVADTSPIRRGFRLSPAIRERVLMDAGETGE